ncbi:methylamine utilization protein MauE [Stackebrandtia endophytica]|uniref:Methylamine utilization protein MauE n=1 Tax=Stackebrandtia endophytica TaxID=1496996 RepID=A0A543ARU2_9ACTN|nr:MauE/DoxX family redox-associated membrane protein [Stackebrandtia endophytica]TQL75256.1 methylamine utilization protein MauE [Stackebrandtia endophytica]
MSYLLLTVQLGLAGVFIVSAVAKMRAMSDTVRMWTDLLTAVRLPSTLAGWGSWALIIGEALTGVALLIPAPWFPIGLWPATALLVGFTGLAVVSARTELDLRCACFGRATTRLGWRHVWRNTALLLLAITGIVAWTLGAAAPTEPAGIAVALLAAALITVLAAFYDDIVDLVVEF